MRRIGLMWLCKIVFPDATVRLTNGGFLRWGDEMFTAKHATFGVIDSVDGLSEGVEAEVPGLRMTMIPATGATPAQLSRPGYQRSPATFWLAEYDVDAGTLIGEPDVQFEGQVDQTILRFGRDRRELEIAIVAAGERLFEGNIGNSLSAGFHKAVWPGETGHDQATGLGSTVAWGVEAPPTTSGGYYGGYSGPPGGGGAEPRGNVNYV